MTEQHEINKVSKNVIGIFMIIIFPNTYKIKERRSWIWKKERQ